MSGWWGFSPFDFRVHLVAADGDAPLGVLLARCGHRVPAAAGVDETFRGASCAACLLTLDPLLLSSEQRAVVSE